MPSGVMLAMFAAKPSKGEEAWQCRHLSTSFAQEAKRMAFGVWLSRGEMSEVWVWEVEGGVMLYFLVSRPRHEARCIASVPGIGAQRRSIGGKICL